MNDPVQIALIVAVATVIPSFLTYLNGRASLKRSEAMRQQIDNVHNDVNGKVEQLIRVSGDARQAVGKLEGLAEAEMNDKVEQLIQVTGDAREAVGKLEGLAEAEMKGKGEL